MSEEELDDTSVPISALYAQERGCLEGSRDEYRDGYSGHITDAMINAGTD